MIPLSVSAKVYIWQDNEGITHFSEKKPPHTVETLRVEAITKKDKQAEDAEILQMEQKEQLSTDFIVGKWTGFNDREQCMQEWIFNEQGIFTIKQSSYDNFEMQYSGHWQLSQQTILLDGQFSNTKDNNKNDSPAVEKQVEIFEKDNNRLLVSFDNEKFWLERH